MSDDRYEEVCRNEFASIHVKLDKLDEAIRGNGKPGIQLRLDRLESADRMRSKLLWLIAGCMVVGAASIFWRMVLHVS